MSELEPAADRGGVPAQEQGQASFDRIDEEEIVLHPRRYPPDIYEQAVSRLMGRSSTQPLVPENAALRLERGILETLGVVEGVPGHNNYRLPT